MNSSIGYRKLSEKEINHLQDEVKNTPNIVGFSSKEWHTLGKVFVAKVKNELAGICVDKVLNSRWSEISMLLVLEKFRGHGIGKKLFELSFDHASKKNRNIYIVSRNPAVIKMFKRKGFEVFGSNFVLPITIQWQNCKLILNFFRIKEYCRKFIIFKYYKNLFPYTYGIYRGFN